MSTENDKAKQQVMRVGGEVTAVVPQSVEEIFRVSKGVVQSGLAPSALTGKMKSDADTQKAVSAVAIVIMAGAELGLPPMVSLRSFTAINGRPALYGDGLINVVRRSGRAKTLTVNYTRGRDFRLFVRAGMIPEPENDQEAAELKADFLSWAIEERTGGFCDAARTDTGEAKVVIFTVAQAMRAGLWQNDAEVMKDVWEGEYPNSKKARKLMPNDSPWYRYPERMLGWRAAGFCLRDLFGDALGGITDDWEAREIEGMVDISPQQVGRPSPPPVPEDEPEAVTIEPDKPVDPTPSKPSRARKPKIEVPPEGKVILDAYEAADKMAADERAADAKAAGADPVTGEIKPPVVEDEEPDPAPPATTPLTAEQQQAIAADTDQTPPEVGTEPWWESLAGWAKLAGDKDSLDEVFENDFDVWSSLAGDEEATNNATEIYDEAIARITVAEDRKDLEAQGQQSLLIDDLPEDTKQAVRLANTP